MERYAMRFVVFLYALVFVGASVAKVAAQPATTSQTPPPSAAPADATPNGTPAPDAAPAAPGAKPPGPESTMPPPPPVPPMHATAACLLGEHEGIEEPDARTTAVVACEALQRAGANVATTPMPEVEAAGYAAAYRIEIRRLGSTVILEERFESPIGTSIASRSLVLNSIEEVPVAAPRIADSLLHGTPLEQTQKVTSLVGEDTRAYQKMYGETLFSLGVLGFALPNDTWAGYGIWGRLYYEAARYAVGLDLRIGGSAHRDGDSSFIALAVGGRYFFNEANISPFVGAGLGIEWLSLDNFSANTGKVSGSGLAGFGEVGVEFLRLHRTRLDLLVRADAPFFSLENSANERYRVPISLMGSYSFN